jgi:hypothetical protein
MDDGCINFAVFVLAKIGESVVIGR